MLFWWREEILYYMGKKGHLKRSCRQLFLLAREDKGYCDSQTSLVLRACVSCGFYATSCSCSTTLRKLIHLIVINKQTLEMLPYAVMFSTGSNNARKNLTQVKLMSCLSWYQLEKKSWPCIHSNQISTLATVATIRISVPHSLVKNKRRHISSLQSRFQLECFHQ